METWKTHTHRHTHTVWFAADPVKEQHYITGLFQDTLSISYCRSLSTVAAEEAVWYCTRATRHVVYIVYTGQRGHRFQSLAVRLEALSTQVQRLSRERDNTQLTRNHLSLLLQGYSALTLHTQRRCPHGGCFHAVCCCVCFCLPASGRTNTAWLSS